MMVPRVARAIAVPTVLVLLVVLAGIPVSPHAPTQGSLTPPRAGGTLGSLGVVLPTSPSAPGGGPAPPWQPPHHPQPRILAAGGTAAVAPSTITFANETVPDLPPPSAGASLAYDPARGVDILFGGQGAHAIPLNETWAYISASGRWTNLSLVDPPPARSGSSFAYDPLSGDLLLFGGTGSAASRGPQDDCWVLPPTGGWTRCLPSSHLPPSRSNATLVSDPAMGGVLLYGGSNGTTNLNDTWLWTAAGGWFPLHPTGNLPRALSGMEGTTLPGNGGVLLYGGASTRGLGASFYFDTYVLSPSGVFTALPPLPQPPSGMEAGSALGAMAFLPSLKGVVLFGGAYAYDSFTSITYASEQTWFLPWNGSGTTPGWTELPVANLSGEWDMGSTYDPGLGGLVVFGGLPTERTISGVLGVRTEFDHFAAATNWTPALNESAPPPLTFPALAYDSSNGDLLLFGGATAINTASLSISTTNETWVLSPDGTWLHERPLHLPPARAGAVLDFLPPPADQFVMFGGFTTRGALNDTWRYTLGGDWTNVTSVVAPPPRGVAASSSLPGGGDGMVLFGGLASCGPGLPGLASSRFLNDTWEYTPAGWRNDSAGAAPSPRAGAFLVPSAAPGLFVLAGGTGPGTPGCTGSVVGLHDEWALDPFTVRWSPRPQPLNATATIFGCAAFDADEHEALYAFGVAGIFLLSVGYNNSVWRAGTDLTFTQARPESPPPPLPRAGAGCVADPGRGGTFVLGGMGSTPAGPYSILPDAWLLRDVSWELSLSSSPGVPRVGVPFLLNASALDPWGALSPRNATLFLSDSTGTLSPTTLTLSSGRGSAWVAVSTPTPSDLLEACGLGVCVNLTTEVEAIPVRLTLSPLPASLAVGNQTLLYVRVVDASGTPVQGWSGNATLAAPGSTVVPGGVALQNGAGRVNVAFLKAATNLTLWCNTAGLGAQDGPFSVVPGPLAVLNLTPRPRTVQSGGWLDVQVHGEDAYGDPVEGVAVHLADSLNDLAPTNATLHNGTADLLLHVGPRTGGDLVEATSGSLAATVPISVTAGSPSSTPGGNGGPPPAATLPWYLVVLVAAALAISFGLLLLVEVRRRELERRQKRARSAGKKKPSEGAPPREKEKVPSGFLAFIPAEEEEEERERETMKGGSGPSTKDREEGEEGEE